MGSYLEPDNEKVKGLLEKAIARNEMIILTCNCRVDYKGRAVSELDFGDRVIMVKPDNTLIVHRPEGRNPVNWMSAGSSIKAEFYDELLELNVENINPREHMNILIKRVSSYSSHKMQDGSKLRVVGSEADMARMIYEKPSLLNCGFKPLSLEEQTKYGFIDVLGHNNKGELMIVECKRYKADLSAVTQLRRYVERVKKSKGINKIIGLIAAPSITKNAEAMLKDWGFNYVKIEPPMSFILDKSRQRRINTY